jgi:two-component system KDP operon response regulator KdpE
MENQTQNSIKEESLPPVRPSSEGPAGWKDELVDQLPLGLFILSTRNGGVKLNSTLSGMLAIEKTDAIRNQEFWNRMEDLAVNPDQVHLEISRAVANPVPGEVTRIEFQTRTDSHWMIGLTFQRSENEHSGRFLGWVWDRSREMNRYQEQLDLLGEICTRSRISAAAASGNLSALIDNLTTWNSEVVADFLNTSAEHIDLVQGSLDLAISYSGLLKGIPVFRDAVDLVSLLEDLSSQKPDTGLRLLVESASGDDLPRAEIDPALTKLGLETILEEVYRHNPPGLQLDAVLDSREDQLRIKLLSPRTLPLPGLDTDQEIDHWHEGSARLHLAEELLALQGGKISLQKRPIQDGGGVDIEIYLPLAKRILERTERTPSRSATQRGEGRILLAESQPDYQLRLREELTDAGYRVDLAGDGNTALDMVQAVNPDLVVVARNLPGMDGLLVTQGIRRWSDVPILMVSSRLNLDDQLYAYRLGVDDYLRKPLLIEELLAKVRVFITRRQDRNQGRIPEIFQSGSVRINQSLRQVWVRGDLIELTPIEYNLLVYMARHGRQIIPYEQLQDSVWDGPEKGTRQGLFVHVSRLRDKIELDPQQPRIIRNKWGVGYVFNP